MSLFGLGGATVREECPCGARFTYSGPLAFSAAHDWRTSHRCRRPKNTPTQTDERGSDE